MSAGLGLRVDELEIGKIGFVKCWQIGCVAEINVDAALMSKLERGKQAIFIVYETPDEGIGLPVALAGLADGLASLR